MGNQPKLCLLIPIMMIVYFIVMVIVVNTMKTEKDPVTGKEDPPLALTIAMFGSFFLMFICIGCLMCRCDRKTKQGMIQVNEYFRRENHHKFRPMGIFWKVDEVKAEWLELHLEYKRNGGVNVGGMQAMGQVGPMAMQPGVVNQGNFKPVGMV
jgi:hypothetical protein